MTATATQTRNAAEQDRIDAEKTFKHAVGNMVDVYFAFGPNGVNVAGDFALKSLNYLLAAELDIQEAFESVRSMFVEDIETLQEEMLFAGRGFLNRAQGGNARRAFEGIRDAKTVKEATAFYV